MLSNKSFLSIDEYISLQNEETKKKLNKLRETIKKATPLAEEVISYNMPAFKFKGKILVYFAAAKNHYALYPTSKPMIFFAKQLQEYQTSKGTIQFLYNKPLPIKLVKEIVNFRVNEIAEKSQNKK